ncbi:hypothetical protein [Metabacillus niabensis]|uniref:hypothetical protein n=1 Tax=Metabacillus niabensis TaxID=324854 RepID=UPI0039A1D540
MNKVQTILSLNLLNQEIEILYFKRLDENKIHYPIDIQSLFTLLWNPSSVRRTVA